MRVTREQALENRQRILEAASKLFREKGFDGIGVADIMKAAGLTHGGFYGHFSSKEDLAAQACDAALVRSAEKWTKLADDAPDDALAAVVASYLSGKHRDNPGRGCAVAALGPEVARQNSSVRRAFTDGLRPLLKILMSLVPGHSDAMRRKRALATMAGLVGAVVLARAVDDRALSEEILSAADSMFGGSSTS